MLKENKRGLIFSSLVILLPIVFGLIFWNQLPSHMATHWGPGGEADGWSGKAFGVFAPPLILLFAHWLCLFITSKDPGNKGQSKKVFSLVMWIMPVVSLVVNGMVYSDSMGVDVQPNMAGSLLLGAMFVVVGNYLPKCKQNYTIGVKIKWTLENEENWNATHRACGRVWVLGGLLLMVAAFLPVSEEFGLIVAIMILLALFPMGYSYWYHRKQVRQGTATVTPLPKGKPKVISLIIVALALILVAGTMFTGNIGVNWGEESFTVEASYWPDLTVDYEWVEEIEFRQTDEPGMRTNGFGSARLLMGTFSNEEFGSYTRYSYTRCDACVVLYVNGRHLVLNGPDEGATKAIYEEIKSNLK